MTEPHFTPVAAVADIAPDTAQAVRAGDRALLIVHHGGRLFAIENRCSHAAEPLECGRVRYGWIACPAHGAKFDLETGDALSAPAADPIATFAVRVVGNTIEVAV
jgi:3-phenylpropionate/trans-cinnamate dioxygenase ferredoxin subunit